MKNITELENLFFQLVNNALDVPESRKNDFVRFAWPTDEQPGWSVSTDVCFLFIVPVPSDIERWRDQKFASDTDKLKYTRVIEVQFVFYGPTALENALNLKDSLNYRIYTDFLRSNNMAFITDATSPVRLPELYNSHWYNKCTFTAHFNELVEKSYNENYISTPDVQIFVDR